MNLRLPTHKKLEMESKGIVLVLMVLYDHPPWVQVIYKDTVGWMRAPVMFLIPEEV